jgi:hypothetical protein
MLLCYTESPLTGSLIGTSGSWSSDAKLMPIKNEGFAVQTQVTITVAILIIITVVTNINITNASTVPAATASKYHNLC